MAENKKMSTAAPAKKAAAPAKAAKAEPPAAADVAPPADTPAAEAQKAEAPKPAPAKPIAKPAGAAGGRPSVAEIMALARAKKEAEQGGSPAAPVEKPAPKPAPAKAPALKADGDKPAAKAAAPKVLARDTASILAAARTGAKPGPMSKADAPPRPAPVAEAAAIVKAPPAKLAAAPTLPSKPVKPAAKKGADAEADRRGFLEMVLGSFMATGFTALSITGGLFGLGFARFMFPNVLAEPPSRFKVGFREGFPAGKVETKYVAQYGVWVVNSDVGGLQQIYALKTVCTHLGCTPNWLEAEQKFKCPCHGSGFYKDGVNFEGPAPRPLERYAIRVSDDGQLEVDKGRTFHEEQGQWADPDSYITV